MKREMKDAFMPLGHPYLDELYEMLNSTSVGCIHIQGKATETDVYDTVLRLIETTRRDIAFYNRNASGGSELKEQYMALYEQLAGAVFQWSLKAENTHYRHLFLFCATLVFMAKKMDFQTFF